MANGKKYQHNTNNSNLKTWNIYKITRHCTHDDDDDDDDDYDELKIEMLKGQSFILCNIFHCGPLIYLSNFWSLLWPLGNSIDEHLMWWMLEIISRYILDISFNDSMIWWFFSIKINSICNPLRFLHWRHLICTFWLWNKQRFSWNLGCTPNRLWETQLPRRKWPS